MPEKGTLEPICVWGVPFAPLTLAEAVATVSDLIRAGRPSFFITAPTHYAMLSEEWPDLRAINERAAFIVADGKPLVWAARMLGSPLPERVAGSDLIFHLCDEAAREGFRVFLLGGGDRVAEEAARRLVARYPGLQIVGTECPPFREATRAEDEAMVDRIRRARPDLLFVAFGQPKGERWIVDHYERLGVPVSVQIGASLDFAAGRVHRAPLWMQKAGLEWAYRLWLEPRRLAGRYARNAWFIGRMLVRSLLKREEAFAPLPGDLGERSPSACGGVRERPISPLPEVRGEVPRGAPRAAQPDASAASGLRSGN
jgi:N-acetylglucosaminyldiphosphoundecaprenol N-acetyl-beta-D-mannosaminyltransferase